MIQSKDVIRSFLGTFMDWGAKVLGVLDKLCGLCYVLVWSICSFYP